MTAAKAADKPESEWLNYADQAVQTAERTFKQALRTTSVPAGWIRVNPKPAYETKGGALGDVPQKAVEYLNGLSLAAARDKVTRVAIGLDQAVPLAIPTDDDEDSEAEDEPPAQVETPRPASPDSGKTSSSKGKKKSQSA
jgi:hypothetical protein